MVEFKGLVDFLYLDISDVYIRVSLYVNILIFYLCFFKFMIEGKFKLMGISNLCI